MKRNHPKTHRDMIDKGHTSALRGRGAKDSSGALGRQGDAEEGRPPGLVELFVRNLQTSQPVLRSVGHPSSQLP